MRILFSFFVLLCAFGIAAVSWPKNEIAGYAISAFLVVMVLAMNILGRVNLSRQKQAEVLILSLGFFGVLIGVYRLVFSVEGVIGGHWSMIDKAILQFGGSEILSIYYIGIGAFLIFIYFRRR